MQLAAMEERNPPSDQLNSFSSAAFATGLSVFGFNLGLYQAPTPAAAPAGSGPAWPMTLQPETAPAEGQGTSPTASGDTGGAAGLPADFVAQPWADLLANPDLSIDINANWAEAASPAIMTPVPPGEGA